MKATQWNSVPDLYKHDLSLVRTRVVFIALLERAIAELYDDHAQLTVNTASSPKLVPSGTDLWAEWLQDRATIVDVRSGSDAERAGIEPGAVVVSVNGQPIASAVEGAIGRAVPKNTHEARNWALFRILAGRHNQARRIETDFRGRRQVFKLPARVQNIDREPPPVTFARLDGNVGYIKLNDSLGTATTIDEFDRALSALRETRGLIIDLRETPSGGNSTVARGILGRFVDRDDAYQKHVLPAEERATGVRRSWIELVSPRGPFSYDKRVAVLIGRWTGSMAEGLAIGFDAVGRGTTVGGQMAQLLGATYRVTVYRVTGVH